MKIAVEGCLHGELQKVYDTIAEIEDREKYKVDLLLCCGDFQATRNLSDLKCMAVPDKYKEMGTFWKYYSGQLIAPILTLVIGGNHEASNHLQELPFGGWLCPNIYYLGHAGVVDVTDKSTGQVILSIGGLSGIYKGRDYLRGRYERPPYSKDTLRSVYHVRNIDTFRFKSMPTGSLDIMLSHDWPRGVTDYGNVEQLLRCKPFFREDIQRNDLGSMPAMDILETLWPKYWFSGHLHVKFAALVQDKTKFLALDKCLPNRRFLQILDINQESQNKEVKLAYNPKWLAILKSTNHLQSSSYQNQHMPGPGYSGGRCNYTPEENELEEVIKVFKETSFDIPENFQPTAKSFDPAVDNIKNHFSTVNPEPQVNSQTELFCSKLGIDDPLSLQHDHNTSSSVLKLSDYAQAADDQDLTGTEVTFNEDEIPLDDDSDDDLEVKPDDQGVKVTPKPMLNLPAPKIEVEPQEAKRPVEAEETDDKIEIIPDASAAEEESPALTQQPKKMKRRNAAMYASIEENE